MCNAIKSGDIKYREPIVKNFRGAHIVCLVYDASRPETLKHCTDVWYNLILSNMDKQATIIVLVGNKCDCDSYELLKKDRQVKLVTVEKGIMAALSLSVEFRETDCQTGGEIKDGKDSIQRMMEEVAGYIIEERNKLIAPKIVEVEVNEQEQQMEDQVVAQPENYLTCENWMSAIWSSYTTLFSNICRGFL